MMRQLGILIGRFQGYHAHHHALLKQAAIESDCLIVMIGSRNRRKSIKNPFSVQERQAMIEANIADDPDLDKCNIVFRYLNDYNDDNRWVSQVDQIVSDFCVNAERTTLYGCDKDASTFYLGMFPDYDLSLSAQKSDFNATMFREDWFALEQMVGYKMANSGNLTPATIRWLDERDLDKDLQAEWNYYQGEKNKFAVYPYPDTLNFSCGDAIVFCHEKVLLIRRKNNPGKGCWAMPGGFKNNDETFYQAAVRELYEETCIAIPRGILKMCEIGRKLFDNPGRSYGVPRSTLAVYFDVSRLFPDGSFPTITPSDDAAGYKWMDVREVETMTDAFDDHNFIITAKL